MLAFIGQILNRFSVNEFESFPLMSVFQHFSKEDTPVSEVGGQ